MARILAEQLTPRLRQQILVEPRPGAGGSIGAAIVAKSLSDGYTLMMANSGPLAINSSLYRDLPYDPIRDFSPIALVALGPYILLAHPSLPVTAVKDLIALARNRPNDLSFGSGGNGTGTHLSAELLKQVTGTKLIHVPYKGTGPGLTDLMAGQVSVMFSGLPPALPHLATRRVRPLAVTGSKRTEIAPEVPTMIEAGIPNYVVTLWLGLVGPAGLSADIVQRIHTEVQHSMRMNLVKSRLAGLGLEEAVSSPQEFSKFIKSELQMWGNVVRKADLRIQ